MPTHAEAVEIGINKTRDILKQRAEGKTLVQIGNGLGITMERVRQIINQYSKYLTTDEYPGRKRGEPVNFDVTFANGVRTVSPKPRKNGKSA